MNKIQRKIEELRLEGLGFSHAEIATELSIKAGCSKRTIYNDFQTRATWQPILQSHTKQPALLFKIINRYEQIYRQASIRLLTSQNEFVQIGALNIMLQTNAKLHQTIVMPEVLNRLETLEKKAKEGVFVQ